MVETMAVMKEVLMAVMTAVMKEVLMAEMMADK